MESILQVQNLTKTFRSRKKKPTKAVDDISFGIHPGEIVGLLGPNGAGKTTSIQMLIGALTPTSGNIFYFGKKFDGQNPQILEKINFASGFSSLPWRMTVWENLIVYSHLYRVKNNKEKIKKLLHQFEMWDMRQKTLRQLSSGQRTRVLLVKSFLNYPKILLLDEPTASLDPDIQTKVRKFLVEQQKKYGVAILLTSHNMKEVQEISDRIIFLKKGKIIAEDTPFGLVKKLSKTKLKMFVQKGKDILEKYLQKEKIVFEWEKEKIIFETEEEEIPKILFQLSENKVRYGEIEILRPTLEDFFIAQSGKEGKQRIS